MPKDNLVTHAKIGLFQSASFKCFLKDYTGTTLNLGNHFFLCYCVAAVTIVVPSASVRNLNFIIPFVFTKSSYLFFPKFLIFYVYLQTSYDKLINKLLIKLLLISCDNVETNPELAKQFQISFSNRILNDLVARDYSKISYYKSFLYGMIITLFFC